MSLVDPVADLITRIRNAHLIGAPSVQARSSKMNLSILSVLKREGYIREFSTFLDERQGHAVKIELKYVDSLPVIQKIARVSKCGRRVYSSVRKMPKVQNGLGIYVVSTSKGMMSDYEARQAKVGGEVVCEVW